MTEEYTVKRSEVIKWLLQNSKKASFADNVFLNEREVVDATLGYEHEGFVCKNHFEWIKQQDWLHYSSSRGTDFICNLNQYTFDIEEGKRRYGLEGTAPHKGLHYIGQWTNKAGGGWFEQKESSSKVHEIY